MLSGFQAITFDLESEYFNYLDVVLQQLFPDSSAEGTNDDMETLTKAYHRYKREYVKHLEFSSETSLSMYGKKTLPWKKLTLASR